MQPQIERSNTAHFHLTQGYFFLCVSWQIPGPPLKTSATNFTWRQSLNEYGSVYFNKCHISLSFTALLSERRLAETLEKIHIFWHEILPQISPQWQRWQLAHATELHEVANCVITELDNIIVEERDPQCLHGWGLYGEVNRVATEPCNVERVSRGC